MEGVSYPSFSDSTYQTVVRGRTEHCRIEAAGLRMPVEAYQGALGNLARNAVAKLYENARWSGFRRRSKDMTTLSAQTLVMAVQGVEAEICRIKDSVGGDIAEREPDEQELLFAFSQAATELKAAYLDMRSSVPGMPPYEQLVSGA